MEMTVEMCWILESGDFLGTFLCTSLSDTGDSRLHRVILFNTLWVETAALIAAVIWSIMIHLLKKINNWS